MKYSCICMIVLLCTVAQGALVSRFTMDNITNSVTSTILLQQPSGAVTFESSDVVCGNASSFGGSNSIVASEIELLPFNFTISVWVKMTVASGTRYGILSTRPSSSSGIPFWGVEISPTGVIIFELSDNGWGNYIDPLTYKVDISSFSNSWHHIVFTKSGTHAVMYYDGEKVDSGNGMIYNPVINTNLMFGKDPIYASPQSMLVDEFRMYDAPINGECLYYYPCANSPCPDENGGSGTCPGPITGQYTKQCNSDECKITLTVSGATQPLFFQWSDGFSTYAPFRNIKESSMDALSVSVVDANNCKVKISINGNPTPKPTPTPTPSPSNLINITQATYADATYCFGTPIHSIFFVVQDNECTSAAAGVYLKYHFLSVSTPKVCVFTDSTCNSETKCVHYPNGCESNGDGTVTDTQWYRI